MAEPTFDLDKAHRWFAIETNNAVWDYLEAETHSADQTAVLIHTAHASCFHWLHAGNEANHARAECQLANLYASAGRGAEAKRHARKCQELTEGHPSLVHDWDIAFALDATARAAAACNDDKADELRVLARQAGENIADPQDKQVFEDWHQKDVKLPL